MKIIGHRGAKGLAPENTLASFAKALEHGVDEIECDARVTGDSVVVLAHDPWLHDHAGSRLLITQHTYAELLEHKPDLTTLVQAVEQIGQRVPLQVEVKKGVTTGPVINTIKLLLDKGSQHSDFLLSSKDFAVLQSLHAQLPEIPTVVIEPWSGVRAGRRAAQLGTKRVSMNQLWLWWYFISATSQRGWLLSAYPLNNSRKARRWGKRGLYAAITDYPDLYQKVSQK